MTKTNQENKIPCLSLYSKDSQEAYTRHFMETLLEGLTAKPELAHSCLNIVCGFDLIVIEVNLDIFQTRERARIIGSGGKMVQAMRKLLGGMCMYRRWRFQLHMVQEGETFPADNKEEICKLGGPIVKRVRYEQTVR